MAGLDNVSVEGIRDVFRCFICMEKLNDARLCPHCSKFCCFQCIRRWITEQRSQCPHCRATLRVSDLVKCRWAEEITEKLETLQGESSARIAAETDTCTLHQEKLSVFCWTCGTCICHHCALWGGTHSGHTLKPLDDEYKQRLTDINAEARKLRRRLCTLIETMQTLEHNIESIRSAKEERVREMKCAVDMMIARIEQQMKGKLVALTGQKRSISMEVEIVEGVLSEVDHQLTTSPPSHLIHSSAELLRMLAQIQRTPPLPPFHVDCEFTNEIVPPYESHVFVLQPFSQLRLKSEPVYSTPLNINGLVWRLKVYPDGNGVVRGSYLSIFLELSVGPPEQARYEYRVEMLLQGGGTDHNERNVVREFTSDFEVGECWGYNRFFKIDHLEPEGFLDNHTDSVVLNFMVRPPNYHQKCKDLEWYVSQLQNANNVSGLPALADLDAKCVTETTHDVDGDHSDSIRTTDLIDSDVEGAIAHAPSPRNRSIRSASPMAPTRTSSLSALRKLVAPDNLSMPSGDAVENDVDEISNISIDRDVDEELQAVGGEIGRKGNLPAREDTLGLLEGIAADRLTSGRRVESATARANSTASRIQEAFRLSDNSTNGANAENGPNSDTTWSVDALLDEDRRIDCPACSPRSRKFFRQLRSRHRELLRDVPWLEESAASSNSATQDAEANLRRHQHGERHRNYVSRRRNTRGSRSSSLDLQFFDELTE